MPASISHKESLAYAKALPGQSALLRHWTQLAVLGRQSPPGEQS